MAFLRFAQNDNNDNNDNKNVCIRKNKEGVR